MTSTPIELNVLDDLDNGKIEVVDSTKVCIYRMKGPAGYECYSTRPVTDCHPDGCTKFKSLADYDAERIQRKKQEDAEKEGRRILDENEKAIHDKAMAILEHGDPMEYIRETVNKIHVGDEQSVRMLISTEACQPVINSRGEHPGVSGESGKGKTSVVKAVAHCSPPEFFLDTSLTPKALYYAGIKEGTTLLIDDMDIPDELRPTLKRATSDWSVPTYHQTVINQQGVRLLIPPFVCWWFTSVDTDDDDQVLNRQLPLEVSDDPETDNKVWEHQMELARTHQTAHPETEEVMISREILRIVKSEKIYVDVPFLDAKNIVWNNTSNRRNFDVFLDVIKSYASLNRYQRTPNEDNGIKVVVASVDDFIAAKKLYCSRAEANATKLSAIELKIVRYIQSQPKYAATIDEIQKHIGKSRSRAYHLLHGKDGNGGLLKKLPSLSYEPQTISEKFIDDETMKEAHRARPKNEYKINADKLCVWASYTKTVDLTPEFKASLDEATRRKVEEI